MPRYRLLALDIDGTLINSREELTAATREAIRRAKQAGIQVVLATGRRYSRSLPYVDHLELDLPLVTASGALIKRALDHQTLYRAEFRSAALRGVLAHLSKAGYDAVLYTDSFAEGFDYYCPRLEVSQVELAEFHRLNPACARVWPQLMNSPPEGVFAGFAMGTKPQMIDLANTLASRWNEDLTIHVLRSPRYTGFMCEIAPAGVSKWSGVLHVAEQSGIAREEICAVGDDVNDIPMIEGAGLGVAMGNALDEVKAAADRIAPGHDSDGLVAVVDWLLEEQGGHG
jgi:Cof subfamily protein (haloacid dehalogenase superfamily)